MVGDEDLRFRSCYAASPAKKFGMGVQRQGFMRRTRRIDGGDEVDRHQTLQHQQITRSRHEY